MLIDIPGFIDEPKQDVPGRIYRGRLALPGVQWTGHGAEAIATVTLTAEQIADAAESRLLWTDQSVQRGVNPAAPAGTPKELPIGDGYPDKRLYIFDEGNADEIAEKLLAGERLFLNPLVWNLRPSHFEAAWLEDESTILLYGGRIYLPDSHHRHQAILKAVRAFRDHPRGYPDFRLDRQFKVELYFLDKQGEGNYFFDKNQRPKPTAKSKAFDLTTQDDLSLLAKRVLDLSPQLDSGVNRVTDRLSKKTRHFLTLSTLRELMKTFAKTTEIDDAEMEGLAIVAAEFFEMLASVRPELRVETDQSARSETIASAAVMMHGYAALMSDYSLDIGRMGRSRASSAWSKRLAVLSPDVVFTYDGWNGDFLSKYNPLWEVEGITKAKGGDIGAVDVINSGGTRTRAGRLLRARLADELGDYSPATK